jgi:dTMP kinase
MSQQGPRRGASGGDPITQPFIPLRTDAQALTNPQAVMTASSWRVKLFGSKAYFRLWIAQLFSSFGDWMGFLATAAIAADLGKGSKGAAVGIVMIARIAPGLFLGQLAGVLVDRLDRKKVMVTCDVIRAGTLLALPFLTEVWQLFVLSLVLEGATLMWSPAKEASVPHLVPTEHLATVNSLSIAAAYGTFPIASITFAGLTGVAKWLGGFNAFDFLQLRQTSIAVYLDAATFLVSAGVIWRLPLPHRRRGEVMKSSRRIEFTQVFHELKEGWRFIFLSPVVRAVLLGLATGLFGGGMLVPLGPVFATDVLGGGDSTFGLLITALGFGMAFGVLAVSVLQRRLPKTAVFTGAVFAAGLALIGAASMSKLAPAMGFVLVIGLGAGAVYVVGFTILQTSVDDALRGRIFASLNTLVRFMLLMSFAVAPFLSELLDSLSKRLFHSEVHVFVTVALPGVRLTLWIAGLIIIGAGFIALASFRRDVPNRPVSEGR